MTMVYCLLYLLLLAPFLVAGAIAFINSSSLLSIACVLVGAIVGTLLIPLAGTAWLQAFRHSTFDSQVGGIVFLVAILPFFAYSGYVTGAWLVSMLYWHQDSYPQGIIFQGVAVLITSVLGGLIPAIFLTIPWPSAMQSSHPVTGLAIASTATGLISASLGSQLAHWLT